MREHTAERPLRIWVYEYVSAVEFHWQLHCHTITTATVGDWGDFASKGHSISSWAVEVWSRERISLARALMLKQRVAGFSTMCVYPRATHTITQALLAQRRARTKLVGLPPPKCMPHVRIHARIDVWLPLVLCVALHGRAPGLVYGEYSMIADQWQRLSTHDISFTLKKRTNKPVLIFSQHTVGGKLRKRLAK